MKSLLSILGVLGLVWIFATPAYAISLSLSDGITTVTCADGDACDANLAAGAVTFSGSVGNFNLNVTTGITYPALGTQNFAELDLNSVDVSSTGGGTLTIDVSEVGYTGPVDNGMVSLRTSVGGTTAGTVSFDTYLDNSNTLFGTGSSLDSTGALTGAFSSSAAGSIASTGPFSLTAEAVITHTGSEATSFNLNVAPVPEPSALLLMGVGLLGLSFWGRRKIKGSQE